MPKESAKEKKTREKAERVAAADGAKKAGERQEVELDEDKARQTQELQERLERDEVMIDFYQRLIHPTSKLYVPYTAYHELRTKMQAEGALSANRVLNMQEQMYSMKKAHRELQSELIHIRANNRLLTGTIASAMEGINGNVIKALGDCTNAIEQSILQQRTDAAEAAQALNKTLEDSKLRAHKLTKDTQLAATKVTTLLQEATSMHTKIPRRIRGLLHLMDKDALLLILDTLSFEDNALQYLLYRFPPGRDDPFSGDDVAVIVDHSRPSSSTLGGGSRASSLAMRSRPGTADVVQGFAAADAASSGCMIAAK